jgi:ribosome-binding ATPase YchF (GTP1/OBG family)
VRFLEYEITMWMLGILKKDWDKIVKGVTQLKQDPVVLLGERLAGLMVTRKHIITVIKSTGELGKRVDQWSEADLKLFVYGVRKASKPMVIAANKIDLPSAEGNIARLKDEFKDVPVIPCSSEAELALRLADKKGILGYMPGDHDFKVIKVEALNDKQKEGLRRIKELLERWGTTGVQEAVEAVYLRQLREIPIFPVEDSNKFTDHQGRVLPDVFLVPEGTTARGLAYRIHTDLGEGFLYAINARTGQKIGEEHPLQPRDIIKIVSAKGLKG